MKEQKAKLVRRKYDEDFKFQAFQMIENGHSVRSVARTETFTYIKGYYSRMHWHSGWGYRSPEEFERKYYEKLNVNST